MILALFAAVALVGTVGASTTIIMRGPIKIMSQVNQKATTESQLLLSSKMILLDTDNLTTADCDTDRLNEPRAWAAAGGAGPDGVTGSDGGGYLPREIGVSKSDTWGNQYGYCVWDHGSLIDDPACGGATQLRLEGTNSIKYPVVAVISAGANGTFETPCRDFTTADVTADGDLEDVGDRPLISRGGDDLIITYSYAEAARDNPSLWALDYDSEGNVLAVLDNSISNVEFSGSNTAFGGNLALTGAEGLNIPDEIALPNCDVSTENEIRRNMAGTSPVLEICEDTGGGAYTWIPLSTGSANSAPSTTISVNDAGPGCVPTSRSLSVADNLINATTLGSAAEVRVRGNYAFVASGSNNGITAFDISDPHNIIELDNISNPATMSSTRGLTIDGQYAYVTGTTSNNLSIIDISNPSNLIEMDSVTSTNLNRPYDIITSDDYAFVVNQNSDGITAFDISDPTNIVELGHLFNSATMDGAEQITLSGNYAFIAGPASDSVTAIDISDPTNLVEVDSLTNSTTLNGAFGIAIKDNYAYVTSVNYNGVTVIDISDPANLVERGTVSNPITMDRAFVPSISGNYLFLNANGNSHITVINISDPDNPIEIASKDISSIATYLYGSAMKDNYLFIAGRDTTNLIALDVCAEDYQGQVTVTQPTISGATIGSTGWSQTLASDVAGDQAGIAFVIDQDAHRGSALSLIHI